MLYKFETAAGTFYIAERGGRFHPVFNDESLGSYATPQQAAEDLADGHAFKPSDVDPSALGIPDDLSEWERLRS